MVKYKRDFLKYHNLAVCDLLPCVICNNLAVNLHHINYGKGIKDDRPQNLTPLCYDCHSGHHDQNNPTTEEIKSKALLTYVPF